MGLDFERSSRRGFLTGSIASFSTLLAGCNETLSGTPARNSNPGSTTPTPNLPSLEVLQNQEISIEWTPELQDYDQVPEEHQTSIQVQSPVVYPNHEEGGGRDWDRGHFSLDKWQQEDTPYGILEWIQPAVQVKSLQNKGGAQSQWAPNMAASIEKAVNQVHDSDWDVHAWGFTNSGAHGTMMTYWENPETNEQKYWHVDTTDEKITEPENAQWHRQAVWSPFVSKDDPEEPGFHPGPVKEELLDHDAFYEGSNRQELYQAKSAAARSTLRKMAGIPKKGLVFMTDNWMDEAYEQIRDDQPLEPILEPIHQVNKMQKNGQTVGLYGTLDVPKIVAGQQEPMMDLYHDAKKDPDLMVDEQHVHEYLEDLGTTGYEIAG